jgi:signal transduction histidine kinase
MQVNQQLRTQQSELKLLNQSKDDFISLASHQLRTPATVVKQLLGMFIDGLITNVNEREMTFITKAYESNERLIDTINDLLKVAQVDSGKMTLNKSSFDIVTLIREIMAVFVDTIKVRKQSIKLSTKYKQLIIYADPKNLRMALENLISNASKYTYASGSIEVKIRQVKSCVEISVIDNGVGIAKSDIGTLFNKFTRVPNDLSDEVGGTGLGLYWANKIVELHGGHIELESELNEGSNFNVILPIGG